MSKRNMIWLAVIIGVGVIAWLAVSVVAGLVGAAVMLAISEVFQRRQRAQRRRASNNSA